MSPTILEYPVTLNGPPPGPMTYPLAWERATLREKDFRLVLPPRTVGELEQVVVNLRKTPLPFLELSPSRFPLHFTRDVMTGVAERLNRGPGAALVTGLPIVGCTTEETTALSWLLCSMVARPVAQDFQGDMVHHIMDYGKTLGVGVRGNLTAAELTFHTDSSYGLRPPGFVALLCLQPAMEGGKSRIISWPRVYTVLLEEQPDLVGRGFRPFLFDRNHEHRAGEPTLIAKPVFYADPEGLSVCYYSHGIRRAYGMAGTKPDPETLAFLDAMDALLEREGMAVEMVLRPGELQLVNNRVIGHSRTAYTDFPQQENRRHLIRLWMRDEGGPGYEG